MTCDRPYRSPVATVRRVPSEGLLADEVAALERLFDEAWRNKGSAFTATDLRNAFGGLHFLVEDRGAIVAHGSVITRELQVGDVSLATGYVEAVATLPSHQHRGLATDVMRAIGDHLDETFQLGALDTGIPAFYEPFGWFVWRGPTYVRMDRGRERTPDEDGSVLVRRTPSTPPIDPTLPLTCDRRPGDVW